MYDSLLGDWLLCTIYDRDCICIVRSMQVYRSLAPVVDQSCRTDFQNEREGSLLYSWEKTVPVEIRKDDINTTCMANDTKLIAYLFFSGSHFDSRRHLLPHVHRAGHYLCHQRRAVLLHQVDLPLGALDGRVDVGNLAI